MAIYFCFDVLVFALFLLNKIMGLWRCHEMDTIDPPSLFVVGELPLRED